MRTVIVRTPAGETWRVRVVWEPRWRPLTRRFGGWRRRRKERRGGGGPDLSNLGGLDASGGGHSGGGGHGGFDLGDDILVGLAVIVGLIVFGALFWWLLLPVLLLVLDVVVVMVLVVAGVLGRVLLRRPWTVRATNGSETEQVAVVGWRAALRIRDRMADRLRLVGADAGA